MRGKERKIFWGYYITPGSDMKEIHFFSLSLSLTLFSRQQTLIIKIVWKLLFDSQEVEPNPFSPYEYDI